MPAGYSQTPLLKKLGIKEDSKVLLLNAPDDYFQLLDNPLKGQLCKPGETPAIVHLFARNQKEYEAGMRSLKSYCKKNPAIAVWVSWYKKSAGIPTDLNENIIRDYALANDWVDIKVCAVSDIWSGLKLVVPVAKRKP
ncbi:MAG: DUF3052 domain-containing protein [Bacteroidetes bacterium]|nr:DUF3052 domain-containing protein [Bacteroidota bacterium]